MMEALYMNDSYLKSWTAKVISVKDGQFVVLDKTAFYPNGGGQPWDEGYIYKNDEKFKVVYVGKFSGNISHEVDKVGLKEGDEVFCELDWKRRYTLMRHHTAAHLLSAIIFKKFNAKITGNQLGIDKSRMDFSMKDYSIEKLHASVNEANEIIEKDLSITTYNIAREEALQKAELTHLAKGLPENVKEVRIVKIGNVDEQADAGTHVKHLKEIGQIQLLKTDNKGKNNRRMYFILKE
jgi:misacylated tRNA(Ala) deacylase